MADLSTARQAVAVATEPYPSRSLAADALDGHKHLPTYTAVASPAGDTWTVVRRHGVTDHLVDYTDPGSAQLVADLLTRLAHYEA